MTKQEPQKVIIVNEKPSLWERIKEYGLFAIVMNVVSTLFALLLESIF